jgi:phosphatidylglycerol:prolipoprotein diacylglycerol transferase
MLIHPEFDPAVIRIGSFAIHWYGLMYLLAFAQFLLLGRLRIRAPRYQSLGWSYKDLEDLLFVGVLGVVLGGRLGYTLFYMPGYYFANPLSI